MVNRGVEIDQAVSSYESSGQSVWSEQAAGAYIAQAQCHARPPQPQAEAPRNSSESHSTSDSQSTVNNQIRIENRPTNTSGSHSNSESTAITGPSSATAETGPIRTEGGNASARGGNVNFSDNSRTEIFNPTQAPTVIPGEGTGVSTTLTTRNGRVEASGRAGNQSDSAAINVFVPGTVGVGFAFGSSAPDGEAMETVIKPGVQNQNDLVGTFLSIEAQAGSAPNSGRILQQQIVQQRIQRNAGGSP